MNLKMLIAEKLGITEKQKEAKYSQYRLRPRTQRESALGAGMHLSSPCCCVFISLHDGNHMNYRNIEYTDVCDVLSSFS